MGVGGQRHAPVALPGSNSAGQEIFTFHIQPRVFHVNNWTVFSETRIQLHPIAYFLTMIVTEASKIVNNLK